MMQPVFDLLGEISRIRRFLDGVSEQEFYKDDRTSLAVQKSLENIGEACIKICKEDSEAKSKFPDIDLSGWASLKNRINHGYHEVNFDEIYLSATSDLDELEKKILTDMSIDLKILSNLSSPNTTLDLYKQLEINAVRKTNFNAALETMKRSGIIAQDKDKDNSSDLSI